MAPKVFFLFSFILILMIVQCHAKLLSSFSGDQKASPYEFTKALQGSQKGAKVKGINELKNYLHYFGYLSDSYNNVRTNGLDDDNFDDALESAIKTYQLNFNLKATGILDDETIEMMMLPRCGVPDIVNGETWMRSGKGKTQDHHGQNNKVHMLSHYKLFDRREKWSSYDLTYGYLTSSGDKVMKAIVERAFDKWQKVIKPRFSFRLVDNIANNPDSVNITIGFFKGDHGDGSPFSPNRPLAHAFPPPDGRMHFNADINFAFRGPMPNEFHFESVAVHELGHILGLNHSSDPAAVMFPIIGPGIIKVDLTRDDIAGMNNLYP